MKNIFTGFILIFFNFSLNLGNSKIGLIPDFLGYIVMLRGLDEMAGESTLYVKVRPYVTGMSLYTGFLYLIDLFGIGVSLGGMTYVLAIVSTVVSLYISYNIVTGVIEMERKYNTLLNGNSLKSTWTYLAVFNVLSIISLLFPLITVVCIIISFIANICFLVSFNTSKNLYETITR